jgi:hypothetical protein
VTVSLLEILAAARAHAAPLAAESAGYLLLAVADHVVAAPRVVTADEVELMPDGGVRLRARRGIAADTGVEPGLRRLLAHTLEVSSSVGPALRRAALRSEEAGLPALVRELETALIPVNRSAAKRALSRLYRETERAKSTGKLAALINAEAAKVVAAPVVVAPVVVAPVVVAPVVVAPVVVAEPVAEPIAVAADYPEPSPSPLLQPVVEAAPLPLVQPAPARAPKRAVAQPVVELTLTPEPRLAVGEPAFTKPEPVVQRAKERGSSTPRLGTLVTLQTLPGEEGERTERAPAVVLDDEPELDLSIDVELEPDVAVAAPPAAVAQPLAAVAQPPVAVAAPLAADAQPLVDPEPSCMPDVLTAMLELHTGVDADEAPTRIRDVVTELRAAPAAAPIEAAIEIALETALEPESALELESALEPESAPAPQLTPEPELVQDTWLTNSSLSGVATAPVIFESERVAPEVHDALTWNPGPVAPAASLAPLPPALVICAPEPEPSPYAPAVLPTRTSDVSELLDSFYVSSAAEERDLRSALKGMAGLELTPMPHPYVKES